MNPLNDWKFLVILCLTLGLAPFSPEPHIWGKIQWVLGGAIGMKPMDWWDLIMHGLPWLLLTRVILLNIFFKKALLGTGKQ
jgi:hypothetical protein